MEKKYVDFLERVFGTFNDRQATPASEECARF
jgi:hypothetical protein